MSAALEAPGLVRTIYYLWLISRLPDPMRNVWRIAQPLSRVVMSRVAISINHYCRRRSCGLLFSRLVKDVLVSSVATPTRRLLVVSKGFPGQVLSTRLLFCNKVGLNDRDYRIYSRDFCLPRRIVVCQQVSHTSLVVFAFLSFSV